MTGLILAAMGRYEEALATAEEAIATARRLGRPDNVVLNYSTTALREIFAVEEALERSEAVVSRLGPSDFNMPWMNARADLIGGHLLTGQLGLVEREWSGAWDDALAVSAWEHWLITGRLAAYRAEWELEAGNHDDAVTWARRAIDAARAVRRRKYVAIARTLLGRALTAQGLSDAAASELRTAVEIADRARLATAPLADARRAVGARSRPVRTAPIPKHRSRRRRRSSATWRRRSRRSEGQTTWPRRRWSRSSRPQAEA